MVVSVKNVDEKRPKTKSGFGILFLLLLVLFLAVAGFIFGGINIEKGNGVLGGLLIGLSALVSIVDSICFSGLKVIKPNEALVLSLFGKYYGTIYESGFHYVNPFCTAIYPKNRDDDAAAKVADSKKNGQDVMAVSIQKKISTKLSTFVNGAQKVNDKLGNPVEVGAIVVWRVVNATKAVINIDNYIEYLSSQTDSIIRNVARLYPYDDMDDAEDNDAEELTLRGSSSLIAEQMKKELSAKVEDAGIEIVDVRINQIAYAPEIAAAMLQRQQAVAIIAARRKIVEGAVSMVEMALDQLKADSVVDLDEERKAQMVSNLLVVLCGNKEANPVLNAGSIY